MQRNILFSDKIMFRFVQQYMCIAIIHRRKDCIKTENK